MGTVRANEEFGLIIFDTFRSVMSVKHVLNRGLELGRSLFQLGILKPAGRIAAKFRGERLRVSQAGRTVQPRTFLPARYRYYRSSLSGLAAQLQSSGFRRLIGGGSPRNRTVFLAFGVGLGLIDQQLDEDRRSSATCQEIQVILLYTPPQKSNKWQLKRQLTNSRTKQDKQTLG